MNDNYGIFEDLHSGANSENFRTASSQRNFAAIVHQAQKDFGFYLASAEDDYDLSDRVDNVLAELRTAGVEQPESVMEALAAFGEDDDADKDSDSSEDDSDVPDFVDTDENDSKDRDEKKESAKTAGGYAPDMHVTQQDSQHLQQSGFQDPNRVMHQQPEGIPGAAPVPAPVAGPGHLGNPAFGGGQNGYPTVPRQTTAAEPIPGLAATPSNVTPGAPAGNPVKPRHLDPANPGGPQWSPSNGENAVFTPQGTGTVFPTSPGFAADMPGHDFRGQSFGTPEGGPNSTYQPTEDAARAEVEKTLVDPSLPGGRHRAASVLPFKARKA